MATLLILLRLIKARLVTFGLALSLALPLGLGAANALPVHATVCYEGAWTWANISENPTTGATFNSQVLYKIGYSCAGYKDSVYIDSWYDKMTFTGTDPGIQHGTSQGQVCDPFDTVHWYCARVWGPDYKQIWCQRNCTITRGEYPRRWFNWDAGITVGSHWIGISPNGMLNYSTYHQFLSHRLYHDFCC